jgi:hypothetical protein
VSDTAGVNTAEGGVGFSQLTLSSPGSQLVSLLLCDQIIPGSPVGYETAKIIYSYHPLGAKLAEAPINMAQSQERQITIPGGPEERLIQAFKREWQRLGVIGADQLIKNTMVMSRVYGISSLVAGERGQNPANPMDLKRLASAELYFNVLDPLNTAGSLVLNQDPNAPDFQKPRQLRVAGQDWHSSRACVMMNEQPVYIEFTTSAFGFVGRSVYQRALYPLKTFVQSMVTDDTVMKKIALLIWKAKSPSSAISQRIMNIFGWKRGNLQSGTTGQVLQIGEDEDIQSLNFQNLEGAGKLTRENVLKNIAMAAGMPARLVDQETMASGLSDGTEDAKQIARYIDRVRLEMQPLYAFCDEIVQRRAWSEEFYAALQGDIKDYRKIPYETAFYQWKNSFQATWPNLLVEPDSKLAEVEKVKFESATALTEVMTPFLDPDNLAKMLDWVAEQTGERKQLFPTPLVLDLPALEKHLEEKKAKEAQFGQGGEEGGPNQEPRPIPFSSHT